MCEHIKIVCEKTCECHLAEILLVIFFVACLLLIFSIFMYLLLKVGLLYDELKKEKEDREDREKEAKEKTKELKKEKELKEVEKEKKDGE